jgi:hypothetical protein
MSRPEKWYIAFQQESPTFRQVFRRPNNGSYFVRDIQKKPEVLHVHGQLSSIAQDRNGAYYKFTHKEGNPWAPLLPGYRIFTCCSKHFINMSIAIDQEERLCFDWIDYGDDQTFRNIVCRGHDGSLFSTLKAHLGLERAYSMPTLLGLANEDVCSWLQSLVLTKYPSIFTDDRCKLKAAERVERSIRSVKRKSEQVVANLVTEQVGIQAGILVNQQGIVMSSKESQALIVMNQELRNQHQNDLRTLKKLRATVIEHDQEVELPPQPMPVEIDSILDTLLINSELGSTIVVDTRKYISLVLSKPCSKCIDTNLTNKMCQITRENGLAVDLRVTCLLCNKAELHSNEPDGVDLSCCAAAAGLVGGINRNSLTRAFAIIGLTKQPGKSTFHQHQDKLIQPICNTAKECTSNMLCQVVTHLKSINQPSLPVSFDVSWSHVRNAKEASGEFIFQGKLPGKSNTVNYSCYA